MNKLTTTGAELREGIPGQVQAANAPCRPSTFNSIMKQAGLK